MSLKTLIGLEIHVELATETKMFCGCKNEFGKAPNTNVCPICLGHPGALPAINKKAVEYAVMAGLAFDCEIRKDFKMDRKKYFYPDLTKGYQITQEDFPLCSKGKITIKTENGTKDIGIHRIHIEEDTGKSIHNEEGNTLMDYNRCGVPLIEIVTEPDMESAEEARQFLDILKERIKYLGISDVKMEEGSLRCDCNLNVVDKEKGFKTKISEIKNMNSFRAVEKAIEYETRRHFKMAEEGEIGHKETRRWVEDPGHTEVMRRKEEGNDYRFSVEGDIPFVSLEQSFIDKIESELPELPHEKMNRFITEYKIDEYDADILTRSKAAADYFEQTAELVKDPRLASNWILSDVSRRLNEEEKSFETIEISPKQLADLLFLVKDGKINNNTAKKVLRAMFEEGVEPTDYVKEKGLIQITDDSALNEIVEKVLSDNLQSIEDIKNGKDRALGFLVGQCMKASKGKGNPQKFNELLRENINKM